MREISLHILDLVQNSIEAGATAAKLEIIEDIIGNSMIIRVSDNGRGMNKKMRQLVIDPFITTRTTRRVGLGLPLMDMSTKRCGGYLNIDSIQGQGTVIEAMYQHSHLDRPPMGNLVETIKSILVANPVLQFSYHHTVNNKSLLISSHEITDILDGIPLTQPDVLIWLHGYLSENIANLYGGAEDENN
ncbi:sensory histidine kinase AtoS [Sporomusa ovata DSM 2662]|uniref:histidine kinase n=1 Tax=Sporomusa ovata TaxID=2378 RepID=A0A0U1L0P7_9FIRM|nr:ATP-binding protein [Sporomusa ovata]EQB29063.1 histidine kinase-, DNA gyrase B-, and HSP90-like ATPase [Sporomusa ovata DSM 2662]CQR72494.1 FIG176532: Sensory transduction histidine kinases [Sporomusa ovata]